MNLQKSTSITGKVPKYKTISLLYINSIRAINFSLAKHIVKLVNRLPGTPKGMGLIILITVIFTVTNGFATEYRVPDHYLTITEALAVSTDGDIISVAPGTYSTAAGESFPLRVEKAVTLVGDPNDRPQIKGDGEHTVVMVGTGGVTLKSFIITDGCGSEGFTYMDGGGICVFVGPDETNKVIIEDCDIENNFCPNNAIYNGCGGGIYCGGTYSTYFEVRISSCTIRQNYTYGRGGGLFGAILSNIKMNDTIIEGNTAEDQGGGIFVDIYASINMNDTYVILNSCPGDPLVFWGGKGGGLACDYYGLFTAEDCIFAQNTARYLGGSIFAGGNSQSVLRQCEFWNNRVYDFIRSNGGSTYFTNSASGWFTRCAFRGNTSQNNGGGMGVDENARVTLRETLLTGNSAFNYGGGIYFTSNSTGTLTNCSLILNSSNYWGNGAAVYLETENNVNIDSSIIWQNSPDGIRLESNPNVNYSCAQWDWPGTGNINIDPKLDLNTFELKDNSPCIDAGNPNDNMNDCCIPPGKGQSRNDMGITGGPENYDNSSLRTFDFTFFGDSDCIVLRGSAALEDGLLRLTDDQLSLVGGAWYAQPVYVKEGFETTFDFQIDRDGAEGFAFVIQNAGLAALGNHTYFMGYDFPDSIAIEFDTNRTWPYENSNHISIQTRGLEQNSPQHEYSLGLTDSIPSLSDGDAHTVSIVYIPGHLSVFIDNLQEAVLTIPIILEDIISLTDGTALIGFTASTGYLMEIHDILCWSFVPAGLFTLNDGLVAYYPFNGNADDESGNNHHGTVYGAELSEDMYENIYSACYFNGYYDYIDISSVSNSIPINHTRCAWIKTNMNGIGQILDTGNFANNRGCYFGVKENKLMVGGSSSIWNNVLIDVDVTDNNWHFVCAVYENRSSARVYMDGEFLAEAMIEYDTGDWITYIGKNHKRDIQYFYGIIDQVRIYDRALSDNEIQTLFQLGV